MRNVVDDVAVLVGPLGHTAVGVGDTIPGIGRIQAIKRSGRDWVVATTKGVIVSTSAERALEPTGFW